MGRTEADRTEAGRTEAGITKAGTMKTDEIRIRAASEDDAGELLKIYAPYVRGTAITFEYEVPEESEFRGRIRSTQERYPWLVAEQNGRAVGYAYAGAFKERAAYDWAVETSIYVAAEKKRGGIGSRLYAALERELQRQGILNLNACIACPETEDEYLTMDSIRFHEKLGYRLVGKFHRCGYKFSRWYHMVWMEKEIGTHEAQQPDVIWWPAIKNS